MFKLHPTLERDSIAVFEDDDVLVRLIDDARYPWVIIVPKVMDVRELHELPDAMYARIMALARRIGAAMAATFAADKINTAAIGNMVPQLHIHIVARKSDDAAWPAPVWGVGDMQPLENAMRDEWISLIRAGLGIS